MSEAAALRKEEDARVTAARRRRETTREKLLAATLKVFLEDTNKTAIAEDVIQAANVSRATFYKYFNSVDEAATALGQRLADQAVREMRAVAIGMDDPLDRASLGAQMLMTRGALHPGWGSFVVRSDHLSNDSEYLAAVRRTTLEARRRGDFVFNSTKAAIDFQIGAVMEGIRRLVAGQAHPRAYICEVAAMALKGLGADHHRAELAATRVSLHLTDIGPTQLPWWRDFS